MTEEKKMSMDQRYPWLIKQAMEEAIEAFATQRYQEGIKVGLEVADRIAGWLTMQPDAKEMVYVREMAIKAIEKCKKEYF